MVGEGFSIMKESSPERGVRVINSGAILWRTFKPTLEVRADAVVDCSGVSFDCIIWKREAIEVESGFVGAED
jgi:hypothetical protein